MCKQSKNRKGISTGIASALIITVAVAVIIIAVVWDARLYLVIGAESGESGKIKVESMEFSGNNLCVCMFNSTDSDRFIVAEYHNRTLVSNTLHIPLPAQSGTCFLLSDVYALGDEVILVTDDGTKIRCGIDTFISELSINQEPLIVESWWLSGCTLTVCVRNNTNTLAIMDAEYQNGVLIVSGLDIEIPRKAVVCITLEGCYNFYDTIMLATRDGTKITFIME